MYVAVIYRSCSSLPLSHTRDLVILRYLLKGVHMVRVPTEHMVKNRNIERIFVKTDCKPNSEFIRHAISLPQM